jgi:hypothetical protein
MKPAPSCELMTHTQEDITRATKRKRSHLALALGCFALCTLLSIAWALLAR